MAVVKPVEAMLRLDPTDRKKTALAAVFSYWLVMVGAVRFELTTPCTPCRCAPGLRHAPTVIHRLP